MTFDAVKSLRRFTLLSGKEEFCIGLRSTYRDENRFEPRGVTIDLAWNGEDRAYSGFVEAGRRVWSGLRV